MKRDKNDGTCASVWSPLTRLFLSGLFNIALVGKSRVAPLFSVFIIPQALTLRLTVLGTGWEAPIAFNSPQNDDGRHALRINRINTRHSG